MMHTDMTHNASLRSWINSADGHPDFPIQNLPLGVFSLHDSAPRGGVAIGDMVLDLLLLCATGLLEGDALVAAEHAATDKLNDLLALGSKHRLALRRKLSLLLAIDSPYQQILRDCLHAQSSVTMHMPARIGDFTDFYVGIHHATEVGKLFRPENPLLPNYKYVPIGYHGRSSSITVSSVPIRRPAGQTKSPDSEVPVFGPSKRLDYELELGIWIGEGNGVGTPIEIGEAADHVGGFCLLNDWSARDIQAWEYQPLGPFLAKNFASTVSPWIVSPEALEPFRVAQARRPSGDPQPLNYLLDPNDQSEGAYGIDLEIYILTQAMRAKGLQPQCVARSNTTHMYWTVAQLIAHHTSNGCNLQPGDLLGSGTISGPDAGSRGSLLEASGGGKTPIRLPSDELRTFLEDGDEVIFKAYGRRVGFASIGFGECRARVLPALK